jgi:hypothetical protein
MPIDKLTKCSILFSPNCDEEIHEGVLTIISVEKDAFEDKYLGLPTPEGRMVKENFDNLQAMLLKRILEWGICHKKVRRL